MVERGGLVAGDGLVAVFRLGRAGWGGGSDLRVAAMVRSRQWYFGGGVEIPAAEPRGTFGEPKVKACVQEARLWL
ncbi:MAG: hypothetical protein JNM43_01750 [Planctomycetaceae bacterium]|nr:hypothetical protein [Planctomycetaceae bacterium]